MHDFHIYITKCGEVIQRNAAGTKPGTTVQVVVTYKENIEIRS